MKTKRIAGAVGIAVVVGLVAIASYLQGRADERNGGSVLGRPLLAQGPQQLVSATEPRERDSYFPNTEELALDEMRVIACGTGMPTARESQAAACFLVELGNGDKFLFDSGTGSHVRIASLEIP